MEQRLYSLTFDRIGRQRFSDGYQIVFNTVDAGDLAIQVFRWLAPRRGKSGHEDAPRLRSHDFGVTIDLETGNGSIEGGRFGSFTVEDRGVFTQ